ncbi:terpenoid synthase [Mycena capillaripes]|nr:terpenoid synthase [Mycena capillaripes]
METQPVMMRIPDPMKEWPWPRQINPHHQEVSAQSIAWLHSLQLLSAKSQRALDKGNSGLLAALAYPNASKEHLRTGCDLLNLIFVVDEYNEAEGACGVREMVEVILDALKGPSQPRPPNEMRLGEATRQFWTLVLETASETSRKHFVGSFTQYLDAIIKEAEDRDRDAVLSFADYLDIRSHNIGAYACFVPGELQLNLPDYVSDDPAVTDLKRIVAHLLILNNDLVSYNKEQALGRDQYNCITIIVRQDPNMDLDGATTWVSAYHQRLQAEFLDAMKRVPSFGAELDVQVQEYLAYLANWPRAQDCWNFESGRYFGSKGSEVQLTRRVQLLPKVQMDATTREEVLVPVIEL